MKYNQEINNILVQYCLGQISSGYVIMPRSTLSVRFITSTVKQITAQKNFRFSACGDKEQELRRKLADLKQNLCGIVMELLPQQS
ncbi:hypothetical protein RIF29_00043 [Crotalaria pallida]|uniref:Uncharacterized protein n=1 Tax=Crotalaria pallida TaxID=3830 RepID=A0AAN9IVC0_CROPI